MTTGELTNLLAGLPPDTPVWVWDYDLQSPTDLEPRLTQWQLAAGAQDVLLLCSAAEDPQLSPGAYHKD